LSPHRTGAYSVALSTAESVPQPYLILQQDQQSLFCCPAARTL
jgi:hypothetical protein